MKRYRIEVTEMQAHRRVYFVEADSPEEARELAENGETDEEQDTGRFEVTGRQVDAVHED